MDVPKYLYTYMYILLYLFLQSGPDLGFVCPTCDVGPSKEFLGNRKGICTNKGGRESSKIPSKI
jgi:hypothetical protein